VTPNPVPPNRHGSSVIELPSELEIVTTRKFDAPIQLVYDVLTKPEHVRNWFAPFEDRVTVCEIDLRVGGDYHIVFVTPDGMECSFRGTYLEIDAPTKTVETWRFEGWGPDTGAVETVILDEEDGVTTLTMTMVFDNAHGRSHMKMDGPDGQSSSFDKLEDYLRSLVGAE
jgi:uncharacterized protein YndB with AHSA1/START domain